MRMLRTEDVVERGESGEQLEEDIGWVSGREGDGWGEGDALGCGVLRELGLNLAVKGVRQQDRVPAFLCWCVKTPD